MFSGGELNDEMFSSVENWIEIWSRIAFSVPLERLMQSPPADFFPYRKRACRMTISSPEIINVPSLNPMPSPGAVCPAMVTFDFESSVLFT